MKEEKELSFFKKIIISIKDFERYPELASKKWSIVLAYLLKLLAIYTLIVSLTFTFTIIKKVNNANINENQEEEIQLLNKLVNQLSEDYTEIDKSFIYIAIFALILFYMFIINSISIILDVILLGAFGYFTAIILRVHLKYIAMCKIAVYSLTLPIILNATYALIRTFSTFEIKYFEMMYIAVAYIYIITAILMIKSDIMKNQQELTRIMQEQEKVRQEMERRNQEEEEKREKEEQRKKEKERENEDEKQKETRAEKSHKERMHRKVLDASQIFPKETSGTEVEYFRKQDKKKGLQI